jgi:hypothetical protein
MQTFLSGQRVELARTPQGLGRGRGLGRQKIFLGSGPESGSAEEPMSVGEAATLWIYAHGDTTTPLATLEISGQHP